MQEVLVHFDSKAQTQAGILPLRITPHGKHINMKVTGQIKARFFDAMNF